MAFAADPRSGDPLSGSGVLRNPRTDGRVARPEKEGENSMGDVIRPSAAVDLIFKDARDALTAAIAKGGTVKDRAEQGLAPVVAMVAATEAELLAARETLAPLAAAVAAENDRADASINRIYDDTWNDVGRPANDRYLALMYPGGAGYYTDGDTPGQGTRMELLAKLYDRKLHPKLTAEQAQAYAARIREAATALKADIDAAATPAANVALLERVRTALGRIAQFELANLKRSFKNDGMNEAAIHAIIPDRPVAKKPKKPAPPVDPEPTA
ncbi:MAG: hypothetical protein IT373_06110 [Polyangiaceae bacterium]|nr:hypothetical protein [Polyangiaceae bacterium]